MRNKQTNPKPKKEKKSKKGSAASVDLDSSLLEDAATAPSRTRAQKPQVKAPKDVYTLVLLLSFIFFVAAVVFLYLDIASYKGRRVRLVVKLKARCFAP